ncbi:glycosyltransferase [Pedobacter gandavensis]|uniref:Glycosyltransferase n=1 Tax=Pedobacter gandavensis TaxID=2679963 RepID=A0ABR6EY54_9SPHI|nr:glycosyltransferase [Pedobacter gandavensis]MBB2149896.1 glycosyltransferase [Pedobacter gandavensis]
MKPSVLFFCASFTSGGVEKVLVHLANHFCKSGYPTSFLVCQQIGGLDIYLNEQVKVQSFNKRLSKCFWSALAFFRTTKSDVVICGPQFINILSVLILKIILRKKTKLIITHHSFYDLDVKNMSFMHLFYKTLVRFFYKYADVVVAVSNAVKNHLVEDIGVPKDKIEVIYNPVIDEDFKLKEQESLSHKWMNKDRGFKTLVCVGRLSKVKNQEGLINLMPDLAKELNCKLILIGDGEEREFLKGLVAKLGMENHVDFIGNITNPVKFIAASDLLILPSVSETFSLVAVESIAAGTPVLSTPTLGVNEILKNCQGCFFESIGNQKDFINKIKVILALENIEVDKQFVEKFNVEISGRLYENLALK